MTDFPKIFRVRQNVRGPSGRRRRRRGASPVGQAAAGPAHQAGPERGHHGRQPRHRQHPVRSYASDRRASQAAGGQAVPRAGHGQPRRRHGRGAAAGDRVATASPRSSVGCPIRASMETVVVCQTAEGFPVHFDRHAFEADHVLVCNRVKPHTGFVGDIESGLMKMMLIGLGKYEGAKVYHRAIQDYSFGQIVRSVAGEVLAQCRIVAGLAIVENAYDQTARIEAVPPERIRRPREGTARAGQAAGCRGCRSTRRRAVDRPRSARTSAARAWTRTSWAASSTTTRPSTTSGPRSSGSPSAA